MSSTEFDVESVQTSTTGTEECHADRHKPAGVTEAAAIETGVAEAKAALCIAEKGSDCESYAETERF